MKKSNYIIAILGASLALASCTKVNVDLPGQGARRQISFAANQYSTATKADAGSTVEHINYSTANSFGTFAFLYSAENSTDAGWYASNAFSSYINGEQGKGEEVTHQNVLGKYIWSTHVEYFWPSNGYLRFASYSPYAQVKDNSENVRYASKEKGIEFIGYVMPGNAEAQAKVSGANAYDLCDLMVADEVSYDCAAVYNTPTLPSQTYYTEGVATLFRHVTTKLNFKFIQSTPDELKDSQTISIKSIKLNNILLKGDFASNPHTGSPAWTNLGEKSSDLIIFNNEVGVQINTDAAREVVSGYYVIPQSLENQEIEITYRINNTINGLFYPEDVTEKAYLRVESLESWAINKVVTYTITLSTVREPIKFRVDNSENWGSNTEINVID